MENSIVNDLQKNGQALADQAADKVQGGIRDAKHAAKQAGATLSNKVDELQQDAAPAVNKAFDRVRSIGRQSMDAVGDAAQRTRDAASYASDSVVAYTRENPVKALLIAAASGALLLSLINVLKSSRD
jgi:ElaB/YqjD/DUF883 family membrane-anchored ribosome-binding protein